MLIHKESRSLLLNLQDPQMVTAYIPQSRVVPFQGKNITQVRFGLDEAKVLRNLGFNAPSPIRYFYDFPSRYPSPFDHQVTTAEFLTLNQRGICLNDMGCVDATTEYLSPTGWVRIDQYSGGQVAQYVPETGAVEFVEPTEYVKKPCPEMIRFKTSRGVDQLLSPEHRVLYVSSTGSRQVKQAWEIEAAHKAAAHGWKGRFITTFTPPEGAGVPLTDAELRLQVAVQADGHFPNNTRRVIMRLKRTRKIARLRTILAAAGVAAKWKTEPVSGFAIATFNAPLRLKTYDARYWAATPAQLAIIADECAYWDGSHRKAGGVEFSSTSRACADFIQYAFSASGRTATVSEDSREGRNVCYSVYAQNKAALRYLTGVTDGRKSNSVWREPSPDGFKYCFMVPSTFLVLRRNGCIFATGNTGKSLSALWAADYLMSLGQVRKVLIVCPKSTMTAVWEDEVQQHLLGRRTVVVLSGDKSRREKMLKVDADFYVINHDGLKVMEKELYARQDLDLWIIDEAAAFRNAKSKRHQCLAGMLRPTTRLWLMTGTPCPQDPTDAWGLAKLMHGAAVQPAFFTTFRNETMTQITEYKWVPKPDAMKRAYEILQPGIRFRKVDCLDMPDVTFQTRLAALSGDQQVAYNAMLTTLVAEVRGTEISAANAAVKMTKLLQIGCGILYDEDGTAYAIASGDRLRVCEELVEEANAKVIVFVPFTKALDAVAQHLAKRWSVAVVDGRTSDTKRAEIFRDFQSSADPHVLVAHPQTAAHGLTLTAADTTIWYAPVTSLEIFEQANNRMNRPGQKKKMTIATIAATATEHGLYQALKGKQNVQDAVLDLFKNGIGL